MSGSTTIPSTPNRQARSTKSPYNKPDADVIIHTSDNVEFRVHKLILSLSSDFFQTMFTLPQSPDRENRVELGVVPLEEDSRTVDLMLRLCYPGSAPSLTTLLDIHAVLKATIKYQMEDLALSIRNMLLTTSHLLDNPLGVYAVAYSLGLEEEIAIAAKATLRLPMRELYRARAPELSLITASALQRLLEYHDECGRATSRLNPCDPSFVPWLAWSYDTWYSFFCCRNNDKCFGTVLPNFFSNSHDVYAKEWWIDFVKEASSLLCDQPYSVIVRGRELQEKYVRRAGKCEWCCYRAAQDLSRFCDKFVERIEEEISKVSFATLKVDNDV